MGSRGLDGAWMNDLALAHETGADVEAGYVWINEAGPRYPGMPFGGWKQSGMGEEESFGDLIAYIRTKAINVKLRGIRRPAA
jgi:betaine-aldehyde dehydrogenase